MVRKIIWSPRAKREKKEILEYWVYRNKSNSYSKKLNNLFKEAIQLLKEHPYIGKISNDKTARIKIVKEYLVIYDFTDSEITILSVWDGRRDPSKMSTHL